MKKQWWGLLGALAISIAIGLWMSRSGRQAPDGADMGPLEIGHETTRIVAPLTAEGRVDYVAALNTMQAPAAEDNAAILLLRVLGTDVLVGDTTLVLTRLGAPEGLTEVGDFIRAPDDVAEALDLDEPQEWTGSATVSTWVESNRAPLDTLVEASLRERLWTPVVRDPASGSMELALPAYTLSDVMDALLTRAELARMAGDLHAGWQDAQALLRFHGLIEQLPGSLSRTVASGIRFKALRWVKHTLEDATPDEALVTDMLRVFQGLPSSRELVSDIDVFDRFFVLETFLAQVAVGARAGVNPALRAINEAFDEAVALLHSIDGAALDRLTALVTARSARTKALAADLGHSARMDALADIETGGASASRAMGEIVADMALAICPVLVKRVHSVNLQIATIALALRLHALRAGAFPEALESLVPGTLPVVPASALGFDISYTRTKDGCRVGDEEWTIELAR